MTGAARPGTHDLVHRPPGTQHLLNLFLRTAVQCTEHSQSDKPHQTTYSHKNVSTDLNIKYPHYFTCGQEL